MQKKYYIFLFTIGLVLSLFLYRAIFLSTKKHDLYYNKYLAITNKYTTGSSAPRGRIIDIKGNIIVDNIGINTIIYHKDTSISKKEELEIAEALALLTNYEYSYDEKKLKDFYLIKYPEECNKLITDKEKEKYKERKITKEELESLKKERITKEMLDNLSEKEKYSSYFYYLMNDGYIYENKILLKNINNELYASILEKNIKGIFGEMSWERKYNYNESLKSILGSVSNTLPKEKEFLLNEGYTYTDKIGISGLEEMYEEDLKGTKATYKVENNHLKLIKEAKRGRDLVLEIDMDIQTKVENIIKEQIEKAKKEANTEFYRESYALISDPLTGSVKAIAGIRRLDNGTYQDVSINVSKNAYTVGSAVKASSMTVGYQNNIIDIGTIFYDSCIKLANLPAKCSYRTLGSLNDLRALALSSNVYQFRIALGISQNKYTYNMKAKVTKEDFDTYRKTFASYGLGAKTGIDLPNESIGLQGSTIAIDLLLNLAIGQYDLYTPLGLLQYINTIANNGERLKLNLMHSIKESDKVIKENTKTILNKVDLEERYMTRIQNGLREVVKSGTGYWYVNQSIPAAGKTGTSESWIDSDYDGKMDSFVLSNTFLMYAPFDNPKYSVVVISPNTSNLKGKTKYRSPVNRLIARNINDFLLLE